MMYEQFWGLVWSSSSQVTLLQPISHSMLIDIHIPDILELLTDLNSSGEAISEYLADNETVVSGRSTSFSALAWPPIVRLSLTVPFDSIMKGTSGYIQLLGNVTHTMSLINQTHGLGHLMGVHNEIKTLQMKEGYNI